MITSPCHIGLDAKIKLGADQNGKIKAAEITFLWMEGLIPIKLLI